MLNGKTIAVVVPTRNEETQIQTVIETMPDFVDRIIVINDLSTDRTEQIVKKLIKEDRSKVTPLNHKNKVKPTKYNQAEILVEKLNEKETELFIKSEIVNKNPESSRIVLINHLEPGKTKYNVGGAIANGYKWCKDHHIDCTAVMAGDGQMDPSELENICLPVVNNEVDYVKANRLSHRSALFVIPRVRFFGNSILSLFTKIASGYWRISDTQTGYTAIGLKALQAIRIYSIYPSYGCPNDILVKLNIAFCTIKEIPSKPVYNVGEKSKMKELTVVPSISLLLLKSFFRRLYVKYLFRDFHPLFLLYHLSFTLIILNIPSAIHIVRSYFGHPISTRTFISFVFLTISSLQSLFFAMWMDMMDNERLYK
ncbi:MAG: glycosyl transferase family 2 [uncultured bacterium]|nr:MAG: glycosyl transferase family 2 [uncultured bacterium]